MKLRKKILIAILLFTFNVLFYYLHKYIQRHPAAITTSLQENESYPYYSPEDMINNAKKIKRNLLSEFKWRNENQTLSFEFPNLIFRQIDGNDVTLCQPFPYAEIQLQAIKIALSGEPPIILAQTTCDNLTLSLNQIFEKSPTDKNFIDQNTRYELRNFDDFWPQHWIIKSIKFYNKSLDGINLNNYEFYSYLGYNLEFSKTN